MSLRLVWAMVMVAALVAATVLPMVARTPSADPLQRRQSSSSSVGPVSQSVIASWQAHGAEDGPRDLNAPFEPVAVDKGEWLLDLAVYWRWPGKAPEFRQGSVGDEVPGMENVHRIVVDNRDLRVQFDPRADTAQVAHGPLVQLNGANVLLLDVHDHHDVTVVGTVRVDPRHRADTAKDPMTALIERSREVAAFVNRTR